MGFGQAVKSVFSKYATFSGRARRSEYWWWQLFSFLVLLPFGIIFGVTYVISVVSLVDATDSAGNVDASLINWGPMIIGIAIYSVAALALLLPSYAVTVRRLHDMGQPGWWVLLGLIGLGIVPVIMAFFDSVVGENQWGPDPKAGERPTMPGGYPPRAYAVPPAPPTV